MALAWLIQIKAITIKINKNDNIQRSEAEKSGKWIIFFKSCYKKNPTVSCKKHNV